MQDVNKNSDFRQFLEDELARRSQNYPRYSLRAFARHLEVDSSFLSKILNGKRTVTMRTIRMFGERLNLPGEQLQVFAEVSREKKMKRKLERLLEKMPSEDREQSTITISVDEARLTEAKEKIKSFRKELAQFLDAGGPTQGKTYQISVSLFPVAGFGLND
jgi:transcriptional regulator with XRE-family HTH domain